MGDRRWGWFLLALYGYSVVDDWRLGALGDALWICHLSNLAMGLGILTNRAGWVRVGMLWILAGTPLWIQESLNSPLALSSYTCHVGGLAAGFALMPTVRAARGCWLHAVGGLLLAQAASRAFTSPVLNVNLAWRMQGMEGALQAYWQYWLICMGLAAVIFYGLQCLLYRLWPPLDIASFPNPARAASPRLSGERFA